MSNPEAWDLSNTVNSCRLWKRCAIKTSRTWRPDQGGMHNLPYLPYSAIICNGTIILWLKFNSPLARTSISRMADEKATNAALASDSQPEEMPVNETPGSTMSMMSAASTSLSSDDAVENICSHLKDQTNYLREILEECKLINQELKKRRLD